jgi:hypothetical protein
MNLLKTHTVQTPLADTFLVYWTNSAIRPGGLLRVRILPKLQDPQIVAELAALQYLLEEKQAIGNNVSGNPNVKLYVSQGAIRKLQHKKSGKAHLAPYANFLTTRFAGCQLTVVKDNRWFEGFMPDSVEELLVDEPCWETIKFTGLGDVVVTRHVLERIADRFLPEAASDRLASTAWKKLLETAADPALTEIPCQSSWKAVKYECGGKQEGRYFLHPHRKLVLVVTDNPGEGKRLVTAYPANEQFHQLGKVASIHK